MNKTSLLIACMLAGLVLFTSCRNEYVAHVGATNLVLLEQIPVVENKFDVNFKASLELLYPHECHDTTFIQEQIFLERIDLKMPFKREFVIPTSLLRDFFGSNNPDKKKTLREELFYFSDTCFEKTPDKQFLLESPSDPTSQSRIIGDYLSRNRKNSVFYLISNDTMVKNYTIGRVATEVFHDPAKVNCRIVSDLRKKAGKELSNTTVLIILIPPVIRDSATRNSPLASFDTDHPKGIRGGKGSPCPPDSVVKKINKHHISVIQEFRNLLHYIATTNKDDTLRRIYREDAYREIHKIPGLKIDGIPGNDLNEFLNSGFSRTPVVSPISDHCKVIIGIRISGR
ncbi:MAG: hypothetical protein Q8M08_02675 [Bacteroidales bacterium]|nr:hypothetical protein [Bacteroidales bacterium]